MAGFLVDGTAAGLAEVRDPATSRATRSESGGNEGSLSPQLQYTMYILSSYDLNKGYYAAANN